MGNTLMSLLVKLGLDAKDLDQGLSNAENKSTQSMDKIGSNMKKTGLAMSAALTVPIAMAAVKFVKSASDMTESIGKMNIVFGKSAHEVEAWAGTTARSIGVSKQQAIEAAGTFGNLFQAMGLGQEAATDMSMSVVTLGADLAAFNNFDPTETLLALRSGLSGEMEPLKKFGVAMNEAAMSSMAMTMGLGDNIQLLTEAEKIQVRYNIIMEQTKTAHGNAAATIGDLAGANRSLQAQIEDVSAAMGERLLPIALKMVTKISDMVKVFSDMTPAGQDAVFIIGGIAAAMGPLLTISGQLIIVVPKIGLAFKAMWASAAGPIGLAIVALAGLAAGLKEGADAQGEINKQGGYWISVGNEVANTAVEVREEFGRAGDDAVIFSSGIAELSNATVTLIEDLSDYGAMLSNVSSLGQQFTKTDQAIAAAQKELSGLYDVNGKLIAGNEQKEKDLMGTIQELQKTQDLQTAQWMTNLLTQQLGIDGINKSEMAFLLQYQVDTGLMSADAATRAQDQWDMAMRMAEGYSIAAGTAAQIVAELTRIPRNVSSTVTITTYRNTYTTEQFDKRNYATGGFVETGGWGVVGDSASGYRTGYEELIHAVPGGVEVIPNNKIGAYAGGTTGASESAAEPFDYDKLARVLRDAIMAGGG